MGFYEILRMVAKREKIPVTRVGIMLGRGANYVNGGASRGSDPSTANAARMLGVCGYALCTLPRDKVPADALVITPPDDDADATRRALERRRERLRRDLAAVDEQLGESN